ncbi:hypothetical protein [Ruegeria arenilitoris]|uniref:hypothetical protein n=1 Tax=Ruegeria arenilitoris TaxID=1173585 RepID=UPI00147C6599|nr:hypothetical protein [Ruegeria arenilitoris]
MGTFIVTDKFSANNVKLVESVNFAGFVMVFPQQRAPQKSTQGCSFALPLLTHDMKYLALNDQNDILAKTY